MYSFENQLTPMKILKIIVFLEKYIPYEVHI